MLLTVPILPDCHRFDFHDALVIAGAPIITYLFSVRRKRIIEFMPGANWMLIPPGRLIIRAMPVVIYPLNLFHTRDTLIFRYVLIGAGVLFISFNPLHLFHLLIPLN